MFQILPFLLSQVGCSKSSEIEPHEPATTETFSTGPERTGATTPELRPTELRIYADNNLIWKETYTYNKAYDLYWGQRKSTSYQEDPNGEVVFEEIQVLTESGFPDHRRNGPFTVEEFIYDEEFHLPIYHLTETESARTVQTTTLSSNGAVLSIIEEAWDFGFPASNPDEAPLQSTESVNLQPQSQLPGEALLMRQVRYQYNADQQTVVEAVEFDDHGNVIRTQCQMVYGPCNYSTFEYEYNEEDLITTETHHTFSGSSEEPVSSTISEFSYEEGLFGGTSELAIERHAHPLNGPTGGFVTSVETLPSGTFRGQKLVSWTETQKEWWSYGIILNHQGYTELRFEQDLERVDFK